MKVRQREGQEYNLPWEEDYLFTQYCRRQLLVLIATYRARDRLGVPLHVGCEGER